MLILYLISVSGTTQPSKAGADILLDLVSFGSPAPSSISGDLLSVDENNAPVTTINAISSNSPTAPSSVMDLLDGFGKDGDVLEITCSSIAGIRLRCGVP